MDRTHRKRAEYLERSLRERGRPYSDTHVLQQVWLQKSIEVSVRFVHTLRMHCLRTYS